MTHGDTKQMLCKCNNIRQIDAILNKTYCKTDADKADYLRKLFSVQDFTCKSSDAHTNYISLAVAIINHRVA